MYLNTSKKTSLKNILLLQQKFNVTVSFMKICPQCRKLFQEQSMNCDACNQTLNEITLPEALKCFSIKALKKTIKGENLSDEYIQYHIRSYIGNRSLFLDYDIQKNRMKHGPRLKRFLICKIDLTAIFNIPWFSLTLLLPTSFMRNTPNIALAAIQNIIPKNTPVKNVTTILNILVFWKISETAVSQSIVPFTNTMLKKNNVKDGAAPITTSFIAMPE